MDRATHDVDFRGPSGNSNSGNQGGKGGPGKTDNGVPIQDKPTPTTTPLPLIPDVEHQAPEPEDLTPLAASPEAPQRKPLQNSALGGSFPSQNGITGYAGVFIP